MGRAYDLKSRANEAIPKLSVGEARITVTAGEVAHRIGQEYAVTVLLKDILALCDVEREGHGSGCVACFVQR